MKELDPPIDVEVTDAAAQRWLEALRKKPNCTPADDALLTELTEAWHEAARPDAERFNRPDP